MKTQQRSRNHVQQQYDRYVNWAKDSLSNGDRIAYEYYMQHAEHFLRVMNYQHRQTKQSAPLPPPPSIIPDALEFI
jgi:hypothetical protein